MCVLYACICLSDCLSNQTLLLHMYVHKCAYKCVCVCYQVGVPRSAREECHKLAELGWLFRKIRSYTESKKLEKTVGLVVNVSASLYAYLPCILTVCMCVQYKFMYNRCV